MKVESVMVLYVLNSVDLDKMLSSSLITFRVYIYNLLLSAIMTFILFRVKFNNVGIH